MARAWGFLGLISASLVLAGFFLTLRHAGQVATVAPFPFIVWGADELRRLILRRYHQARPEGRG